MENKTEAVLKDIQENLKIKKLDMNASLSDLGLDSLDVAEYLLKLEEKYSIEFTSEEMESVHSLGELVELIDKKVK